MILLHPQFLFLLPLAALLGFLEYKGQKLTRSWQKEWRIPPKPYAFLHPWIYFAAGILLVFAFARPVWDPQNIDQTTSGQDTVFLVDVSRSMDTPDIANESRLQAVKLSLLELIPSLEGDRVALVAFAGTTVPKCPLTMDYTFFQQSVSLLDTSSTSRGGTLLGDALRNVRKDFTVPGRSLSVWVFTDGGDQESYPVEAVKDFGNSAIRLYIWGVGTLDGGQVPERGVSSALNEGLLRDVAQTVPGGVYYGSSSALWTLPQEYRSHHKNTEKANVSRVVWKEFSWWLIWVVLLLLVADTLIRVPFGKKRGSS